MLRPKVIIHEGHQFSIMAQKIKLRGGTREDARYRKNSGSSLKVRQIAQNK